MTNKLTKLCEAQGWDKNDISRLLPSHPSPASVAKWLTADYPREIPINSYMLLLYIAKFGEL